MMIVCLVSFLTILSSVTVISSSLYQRKEFEEYIGYDIERVLHLMFNKTSEDEIFIDKYNCFLSYVDNDKNIKKWGRYDQTGVYFRELEGSAVIPSTSLFASKSGWITFFKYCST